ncbi:MAG: protein-export chaperone SecB [Succinivibrionaceae bacterium]|nr:protein-export chaperone SecB [Succinivibrionaceae bacterium]
MSDQNTAPAGSQDHSKDPYFDVIRVYARDSSLEFPGSATIFAQEWKPEIKVGFEVRNAKIADDQYEVVLRITLNCTVGDKTAYVVEVNQAGLFVIRNVPADGLEYLIGASAPNILFPYAREFVASLVNRATFPQVNLAPLNFEAMFRAKKIQEQQQAAAQAQAEGAAAPKDETVQ